MDREIIADQIMRHCTDDDGFLFQLRVYNQFDAAAFQALHADLLQYHAVLGSSPTMERRVAGCLFDLLYGVEHAVAHAAKHAPPWVDELETVHAELFELISMISFGPED